MIYAETSDCLEPYTMVDNSQEYRLKYWATRSSVRSLPCSWESDFFISQNDLVLSHSAWIDEGLLLGVAGEYSIFMWLFCGFNSNSSF